MSESKTTTALTRLQIEFHMHEYANPEAFIRRFIADARQQKLEEIRNYRSIRDIALHMREIFDEVYLVKAFDIIIMIFCKKPF